MGDGQRSLLWGERGERWRPTGRIPDWSYAGYMGRWGRGAAHRGRPPGVQAPACACLHMCACGWVVGSVGAVGCSEAKHPGPHAPAFPTPSAAVVCPAANERPIPDYPVRVNVKDFGAVGDGVAGEEPRPAARPLAASPLAVKVPCRSVQQCCAG